VIIALTIFFLMYHLIELLKGSILHTLAVEVGEDKIRKHKEGLDNFVPNKELDIKLGAYGIVVLFFSLIQFMYICTMIQRDPYLFPTVGMITYILVFYLFRVVKPKKKPNLSTERDIEKYRKKLKSKFKPVFLFNKLVITLYFVYMVIALIFVN